MPCLCGAAVVQSCVLFQLELFKGCRCSKNDADADGVKADKNKAQRLIKHKVLPIIQKLLRSFDAATVDPATGNNVLHEMCRFFALRSLRGWDCKLFKLLIAHGVSLCARNKQGRTPLLLCAADTFISASCRSTDGMRLLLSHGAGLNAQDGDGNSVLHLLVLDGAKARLEDLLGGGGVAHFDYALRDNAGQTAVDIAAIRLARQANSSAGSAKRIHQLLMAQTALWVRHTRPQQLHCLESALAVTDVAKLALGCIDGSGPPFTAAEKANSDEEAEPDAAAVAQS